MKKLLLLNSVILLSPLFLISCKSETTQPNNPDTQLKEDTKINSKINIDQLKWSNQSVKDLTLVEFRAKIEPKIKQFILENKTSFFTGNISKIENEQDLENVTLNFQNDTIVFATITIAANRWYKNNTIQTQPLSQQVELFNFKTLPTSLDDTGGKLINSNLQATKYTKLFNLFNLSNTTTLSSLDDQYFNQKLSQVEQFKTLKVTIIAGNTETGTLDVQLSGKYENQDIQSSINISGFNTLKSESIGIQNLTINKNKWFDQLQPIDSTTTKEEDIKKITSEDWSTKYIDDFMISNSQHQIISSFQKMKSLGINFTITSSFSKTDNKVKLNVTGSFKNKTYDQSGKKWVDSTEVKWSQLANQGGQFSLFTKSDVEQYILDTTTVNEEKIKTHYPSYFIGLSKYYKSIGANFVMQDLFKNDHFEKLNNKYLNWTSSGFTYAINPQYITADDFKNTLSFNMNLVVDGELKQDKTKQFTFSNINKNINENTLIKDTVENKLALGNLDFKTNTLLKSIKARLKSSYKSQIDQAFKMKPNESITIENISKLILDVVKNSSYLSLGDETELERAQTNWTNMNKYFLPYLFNQPLKFTKDATLTNEANEINASTGLYTISNDDKFFISSIYYDFPDNVNLKITNMHENAITISLKLKTRVEFSANETKEYESALSFTMLKTQWEE